MERTAADLGDIFAVGHEAEKIVAAAYEQEDGNPIVMSPFKSFDKWDFRRDLRANESPDGLESFETRVEVKYDAYASKRVEKHGNIEQCNLYFELSSYGKRSGIMQTLADEWAHVVGDKAYIFDPRDLRAAFFKDMQAEKKIGQLLKGGEANASTGWVVPFHQMRPLVKRTLKLSRPIYVKPSAF